MGASGNVAGGYFLLFTIAPAYAGAVHPANGHTHTLHNKRPLRIFQLLGVTIIQSPLGQN